MKTVKDLKIIIYNPKDKENKIVENFLSLSGKIFKEYTDEKNLNQLLEKLKKENYLSKEILILKKFYGRLFQKCPGSPNVICCNYSLLNTCFDCLYNCTYCFLNSYLNNYGITQFINLDNLAEDIEKNLDLKKDFIYRIGTGEFTDSLMMDETTGLTEQIIQKSSSLKNIMIEFKTKSDNVDHLLKIKNKRPHVLAWSLNTEKGIKNYEEGTASLGKRIAAALKVQKAGFYLAFHFDPIIIYENFMSEYLNLIDKLFGSINPDKVVWISLGGFRYTKGFKEIIRKNFPLEKLTTEEMFPGIDGKFRYLKQKRIEIYTKMKNKIYSFSKKPFVYLCMESKTVWKSVFDVDYHKSEDLELALSEHLKNNFFS